MAAGQGAQQGVTSEVAGLGSNLIFVEPGETEGGGGPVRFAATTLTTDDADAIEESEFLPNVDAAISQFELGLETQLVGNGRNTSAAGMVATEPDFTYVRSWDVAAGRFISDDDMRRKSTNVVLGSTVAEELFDTPENAIGQDVRLNFGPFSLNLTVVGVMEKQGGSGDDDRQIIVPLTRSKQGALRRSATDRRM
jgi:putative ABC transport system permease protein